MNRAFDKGHRAGTSLINPAANPFPRRSDNFFDWQKGHSAGRQTRKLVQAHEFKLYRGAEQARLGLLWGV